MLPACSCVSILEILLAPKTALKVVILLGLIWFCRLLPSLILEGG